MTEANYIISKNEIRNIFVRNGFKTRIQDGGKTDLNPYVYDAAYALIEELHRTGRIKLINKGKKTIVGCFSSDNGIKEIEY